MRTSRSRAMLLPGIPRLPARAALILMPLLLSIFMTCLVSLISTWKGVGWIDGFIDHWMQAWLVSWMVAFPALLLVLPLVRSMVARLVQPH